MCLEADHCAVFESPGLTASAVREARGQSSPVHTSTLSSGVQGHSGMDMSSVIRFLSGVYCIKGHSVCWWP